MSYCLLQADSVAPTVDQLKRAFKSLKTLTEADAIKLAREACGILMKNLSLEAAGALQYALRGQGVATDLIDSAQLPNLPGAKLVHRLEFQPQALAVFDPLGRVVPVPWEHVALISAGIVRHFGMSATRKARCSRDSFSARRSPWSRRWSWESKTLRRSASLLQSAIFSDRKLLRRFPQTLFQLFSGNSLLLPPFSDHLPEFV